MNTGIHSKYYKQLTKALYKSCCSHIKTRKSKWKSRKFMNDSKHVTGVRLHRYKAFELQINAFKGLSCFNQMCLFRLHKTRFTFVTNSTRIYGAPHLIDIFYRYVSGFVGLLTSMHGDPHDPACMVWNSPSCI